MTTNNNNGNTAPAFSIKVSAESLAAFKANPAAFEPTEETAPAYRFTMEYANGAENTRRHHFQGIGKALQLARILYARPTCEVVTIETPNGQTLRLENNRLTSGTTSVNMAHIF